MEARRHLRVLVLGTVIVLGEESAEHSPVKANPKLTNDSVYTAARAGADARLRAVVPATHDALTIVVGLHLGLSLLKTLPYHSQSISSRVFDLSTAEAMTLMPGDDYSSCPARKYHR